MMAVSGTSPIEGAGHGNEEKQLEADTAEIQNDAEAQG